MNNEGLDQKGIWEYAQDIIVRAPRFHDFAVAVMDFVGGVTDKVFPIYNQLRNISLPTAVKLDDPIEVARYTTSNLTEWYRVFQREQKEKFEKDKATAKANIDELQYLIEEYRSSDRFRKMMEFIGRFPYLAPYNAMLVERQKPSATFVFTAKRWKEDFFRRPKINAQQLITLVIFGPVQFMFDFSDTEPLPDISEAKANEGIKLMEAYENQFNQAQGEIEIWKWKHLEYNLSSYGIILDETFNAANSYAGYLLPCYDRMVTLRLPRGLTLPVKSRYYLSVNKNLTPAAKFATICHELGHLFCRHLFYDSNKVRRLSQREEEFEAETVAWLVCKRQGIINPSEEYLAMYSRDGKIPICSLDTVLKAVAEIEKMLLDIVPVKKTLWYSNDSSIKMQVDEALKIQHDSFKFGPLFEM